MLNKHNLNIATLCCKEQSRYSLNSLHVTPKLTEVTDGHLLISVTTPELESAGAPSIDGLNFVDAFNSFMLDSADALSIAKAIPAKTTIPILRNAFIDVSTDVNGTAKMAVTDDGSCKVFDCKKASGTFPDTSKVIPNKESATLKISVNPNLLLALMKQFTAFTKENNVSFVTLRFTDMHSPIRMDATNTGTGQVMTAVLMPQAVKDGFDN